MAAAALSVERSQPPVVWRPLPGSQHLAVSCPCHHVLFHGSRGPGKTDAQLMAFRKQVGRGYGRFWRGIIFDREYKNLDDLVAKSRRWFTRCGDGARFLESQSSYKWVWPTGEELLFRRIKRLSDYDNYHGHEYPFVGWNELTKYPTSELYDMMMSCNRSSFVPEENRRPGGSLLPEIPLVVFSTTNPHGVGHHWVKARFIDRAKPREVLRVVTEVFNPRTKQREKITKTQVHIFGSYQENRYLAPEYVVELEAIRDPNRRRAWRDGDWNIVAGGALDDVWEASVVVVPRFKVPHPWRVDRSMDWGSSHPFSVGWWAEANGEEATLPDGSKFCPPAGTLVRIHEWYGTEDLGTNRGLKLSAANLARGVKEREAALLAEGWIGKKPAAGPADNQIFDTRESDVATIAKKMADEGVEWTRSDKSPGSRKNGLQLIRDRLESATTRKGPGLFFMEHCKAALATLPVIPRDSEDPDDVDTDAEDHPYDDVRYRCLSRAERAPKLSIAFAT